MASTLPLPDINEKMTKKIAQLTKVRAAMPSCSHTVDMVLITARCLQLTILPPLLHFFNPAGTTLHVRR